MTVAISKALGEGARAVICASTGNTAASAAAYAGRAGLRAFVLIPKGAVALGKLSQSVMHGARVLEIIGNFDICLKMVRDLAERDPVRIRLVNSVNPDRIAGQKTAAFEICDQLGDAPTHHFLPVGNAGNITAYWAGYREYSRQGLSSRLPKMMGYQAEGAAPIVRGHPIDDPQDRRDRDQDRQSGELEAGRRRARRIGRHDRFGHRRRDSRRLSPDRGAGNFRRTGLGRFGGGRAQVQRERRAQAGIDWWSARSPATASRIPTPRSRTSATRSWSSPTSTRSQARSSGNDGPRRALRAARGRASEIRNHPRRRDG